jgi:hypothetical protein
MQAARNQISQLPIENNDFSVIRGGIQRVYRRGKKLFLTAYKNPNVRIFHEWRKNVKYLWYELEFLGAIWPSLLSIIVDELHTLSDYLGYDHDLAVLRLKSLESPHLFFSKTELLSLIQIIDLDRLHLEERAKPLGMRLYADRPGVFIDRLQVFWDVWTIENRR